jgi:aspartyl-tRNA(Asn)/glutamyl-tRNA(Gln) amidotransferase subunit C
MISREEVEGLARLARIKLAQSEIEPLQKDISDILEYVSQLSALEVSTASQKVAPRHHNVMRSDTLRLQDDPLAGKEEALRAAFPKSENGFDVVRKIIQKDE